MEIKLRARLSAYTKIESIQNSANIPDPDIAMAGNVLGVNNKGKYTLFPHSESTDIDELFSNVDLTTSITKEEIDSLL